MHCWNPQIAAPTQTTSGPSVLFWPTCLILSGLLAYHFACWASQLRGTQENLLPEDLSSESQAAQPVLLFVSQETIDFGRISRCGRADAKVSLQNRGSSQIKITGVNTSCECFSLSLSQQVIEPGETISATARVDFSDDTDFTGKLMLEAKADAEGQAIPAFIIHARVKVSQDDSNQQKHPVGRSDRVGQ